MNDQTKEAIPFVNEQEIQVPFAGQSAAAAQSREIAEIQALIMAAQRMPRDEGGAMRKIKIECQNMELAANFEYVYTRGGTLIQGPSINLARVIAQHWGRLDYGYRILSQTNEHAEGFAFALDLQNLNRTSIPFMIKKWRDTRSGGYALTEERDIYEHVANQATRRVRGCLLSVLSKTCVDTAMKWCNETAVRNIGTREEAAEKIIAEYDEIGVTEEGLSIRIGKKLRVAKLSELIRLHKVYTAIVDGMTTVVDEFPNEEPAGSRRARRRTAAPPSLPPSSPPPVPPDTSANQGEQQPPQELIDVDRETNPNVPEGAKRKPDWPPGLFYHKPGNRWYDAHGHIFDKQLHGWNNDGKHPSMNADGTFRTRRGLKKETDQAPPPPPPPQDQAPPPQDQAPPPQDENPGQWQPGQQNDYAEASGR